MALVSPGISISINDQSQYVNSNVGSVPLVILATAQDKTYNGGVATGTTAAKAGSLLSFSSQRDLVTQMGAPTFQLSSTGTPVNGSEINEYGLMAAYSALGLSNQLFAIRADVDLNQLVGTSVRPIGAPAANTYWLDTANTSWGIYSLNATTQSFGNQNPLIITDPSQVSNDNSFDYDVPTPVSSVGNIGDYALVFVNVDGTPVNAVRLFYKASAISVGLANQWVQVGSTNWQNSVAVVTGTVNNPTLTPGSTLTINSVPVTLSGGVYVTNLASSINSANIPGVSAIASSTGQLILFVTSAAMSDGANVDGKLIIVDGTYTPLATCGIVAGTYNCPILFYGTYAQAPSNGWYAIGAYNGYPSGSIWWKPTSTGGGFNAVLKKYNSAQGTFQSQTVPAYANFNNAIYGLDPTGGGANIAAGQLVALYGSQLDTTANALVFEVQQPSAVTVATGGTTSTFTVGNSFTIRPTLPGTSAVSTYTITLSGSTASTFVSDILAANIPYVSASVSNNNIITITHTAGGTIQLQNVSGTPLADAGFGGSSGTGYVVNSIQNNVLISNFSEVTDSISYQNSEPYAAPETGTYWYYSDSTKVDIMINNGTQWKGYRNVTSDVRGYNLSNTDSNGVIITPTTAPSSQSDGTALVAGDLWLDSGDLTNFPALYRYNGTNWVAIDNSDHVTSNGIIFADARWDTDGTTDIISGDFPAITELLTSDYVDLDAPNPLLYPRGTLLFNMRRSGYNVKKYVADYFNSTSFPNESLPTVKDAWVTASGLDSNGAMKAGSDAQRAIVVAAMQAAVDSNLDVLSSVYQFNLVCAPGYPELIPNLLTLNANRGNTAFVIGDTPMTLAPNTVDITNWVNNTGGNGLPSDASSSPYLALYYPAGLTNDLSGNTIVVPASHAVLRTFLYNDQVSYPWFAPAGLSRGLISNLSNIGYINSSTGQFIPNAISQGLRNSLFTLNINPMTQLPNTGLVVFGQLTRSGSTTSRNRINVVRLENYLRTIFNSIANGYLFEPNDAVTRKSIATQIERALSNILSLRGLYDFLVICDTSNNTPATISNNQLYVDVAIEPMRDVEFIYIPIAIYNPGSIAALNTTST